MKRIGSSVIVALLFLGLSVFAFNVQPAKAQLVTIVINPNGSISSPAGITANITTSDNVTYTFNGTNYLPIVVNRSNIIINGRDHTLQALGGYAFYLSGVNNVTIKNTTITNSSLGIHFESSSNCTLTRNNITNNTDGIELFYGTGNILSGNNVTATSEDGIDLYYTSGNILSGNNITANSFGYGIGISYSSSNILWRNNVTANKFGIYIRFSSGNVLSGNNVTANTYDGIDLLTSSDNNTLSGNTVTANSEYGVDLYSSSGNVLSGNNVTANTDGIYLYSSSDNTLSGNNIANSIYGILAYSSDNNTLFGNNFTANSARGVALYSSSDNNTLSGNNIANSACGIELSSSSGNTFYHNNFDNTQQVYSGGSPNTWDNGYPSGGNYWSSYTGADQKNGLYQNLTGSDGIGDTSYAIDVNNTDRYPLMGPFHTFGVGTFNGTAYSVDTVCNSTITDLSFNATLKTLTFNVTGANGTMGFCRVTIPIALMSGEWTVRVNGTSIAPSTITYGNYTYIYFAYHHSTETVQIISTSAIPEFQPFMLLPLLMMITLLTAIVSKRKRNAKK